MNFDSSSKITLSNIKQAQSVTEFSRNVSRATEPGTGDNPAKNFVNQLLERVKNIGEDAQSVEDLLVKRINVFTNLRLVLNDSEIIDYFQKFVDGADIPIEETLDLFDLAYKTNMAIGKNIREVLEFILNHRSWNRNPELTKDIVEKTTNLATSTSTRFFPYFSMLLNASDPNKLNPGDVSMLVGLDPEAQQAFRELVNLAAKTDKDTVESIRVQQQAAQDALDVAKDKYSLTRGIVEVLEKSSYEERLAKTIMKLDNLFRKRYSTPGYRKIKLMMFDLHFGQIIYKQLFADLNSTTDLKSNRRSNVQNQRFAAVTYTLDQIKEFNAQDIQDMNNFLSLSDLKGPAKTSILEIVNVFKSDLDAITNDPKNYITNYAKAIDKYINSLRRLLPKQASSNNRVVTAAPPALPPGIPAPIASALTALSSIPGIGPAVAPLVSAISSLFSSGTSIFGSNLALIQRTILDGIAAISSFNTAIINIPLIMNAIATNNVAAIQGELNKFMTGQAFNPSTVDSLFKLLQLTAVVNRDFTSIVSIMMADALLKKRASLTGKRPLPSRTVTPQERQKVTDTLVILGADRTRVNLLMQLKDFRIQTVSSLDNQKELTEALRSVPVSIPGVSVEAPTSGEDFSSSMQQYYNDLSKAIKMFQYERQGWDSLLDSATPENREALSVFLKKETTEVRKDILNVTRKLGEVALLGIGNNAQTDQKIRFLEQENLVGKELFSLEKNQGVQTPLSGIAVRENFVEQRNQYRKMYDEANKEYEILSQTDAEANMADDYNEAFKQVEKLLGRQIIDPATVNSKTLQDDVRLRLDVLKGIMTQLDKKIIQLQQEIINVAEGGRQSMSKFTKVAQEKKLDNENTKEADEVTEDYWNELLPGFGTALEKPKKWRKVQTEDIPVKFNLKRKWTH